MAYFKESTRRRLSEREKQAIIDAVHQAMLYLGIKYRAQEKPVFNTIYDAPRTFKSFHSVMVILSRMLTLIKGNEQPKSFYKDKRKIRVLLESHRIAEATGADVHEVNRAFRRYMSKFIFN